MTPKPGLDTSSIGRGASASDWIERIVAEDLKNLDGLSRDQLLDLRIATLQKLEAALAERLGAPSDAAPLPVAPKEDTTKLNLTLAQAPLAVAIPTYLATCSEAKTVKQIAAALLEAGREFESDRPVHTVRTTLGKLVGTNPDVFHATWCKWWLKSKCTKRQLEKYLAKNAKFGTGGHGKKEHSRRTAEAIQKRISQGQKWGRAPKATPEVVERAKQMLRDGATLRDTCNALGIAIPTLYQFGVRQRVLREEGRRMREAEAAKQLTLAMTGEANDGDEDRGPNDAIH